MERNEDVAAEAEEMLVGIERAAAEATDVEGLLAAREYLYTLFHKLLGGTPSAELLDVLTGSETARALGAYAAESGTAAGACALLESLRAQGAAAVLDAAKDEYTRLFVGPGTLVALPWESPYTTKQGFVCQEAALAVRRAYKAHGLQPRKLQRVPDDHVSLLCAFMAALAGEAAIAADARDAAGLAARLREQGAFMREHLASWLPEYARLARRSKTAVLYPQMAELLAEFVRLDAVFVDEAAFWAESLEGEALPHAASGPETRALRAATARMAGLALFGLADNELAPAA